MALENRRFLRGCRRHLRVSGAGRREGGDLRLQLERAPLRGRSSPCSPFPPPRAVAACPRHPPCAARLGEGRGRSGRGRQRPAGGRESRGNSCPIRASPRPGRFPALPGRRQRRQQEGAQAGEAGAARRGRGRQSRR